MWHRFHNFLTSKDFLICLFLYLVAYAVSAFVLYHFLPHVTPNDLDIDETYYYNQAFKLASGTYTLDYYRPIGFPLILAAALYLAKFNIIGAKLLLLLIGSLRVPLLYIFVKRLTHNTPISFLSALATALWPTMVYLSASFYTESVGITFFLAFLNVLPFKQEAPIWQWLLAGILLGILLMIHPAYLVFVPFVFIILAMESDRWLPALKHFSIVALGAVLVVLPWSITISKYDGNFLLLSANSGDALAGGLNQKLIDGGYQLVKSPSGRLTWSGPGMWISSHGYLNDEEERLPPGERNALLDKKVKAWVMDHPKEALYLEAAKLGNLWGFFPIFPQLKERVILGNIPIMFFFVLALCALWTWRAQIRALSRFWSVMLFVSLVALIGCGSWRYRATADTAIITLGIALIYTLWTFKPVAFKPDGRSL